MVVWLTACLFVRMGRRLTGLVALPFDESIISVSNIIFESVLFNLISFLELIYLNCKLFNFRNKYSKDSVLKQKKEDLELIRA